MARRASSCPASSSSSYADPMIIEAQTQRIDALESQNATVLAQMAQQSAEMAAYRQERAENRRINQELMKKMEEMYRRSS